MIRAANGTRVMRWVQKHSHGDNHYLDCEVYAMAAAEIMGVRELHLKPDNWDARSAQQKETEGEHTPEETWIEKQETWLS